MAKIGYARVSTVEQNEERQIRMLIDQGVEEEQLFIDKASGKNRERPQLKAMLGYIRRGDVVIVESFSRIARNTRDLLDIVDEITNVKGAEFISLKENIDTATPQGKFMLTIFGACAELERESIKQRQAEGIAIAKEQGKYTGRPKAEIDEEALRRECKRWRDNLQTAVETMKKLNMKPNTFYRRVKELGL